MAEVEAPTKADAIALLARRLRRHYGPRLKQLFLLKDDPYEPSGEDFGITLVAVFGDEGYDHWAVVDTVIRLAGQVDGELDYAFASTVYPVSRTDLEENQRWPARAVHDEGVAV